MAKAGLPPRAPVAAALTVAVPLAGLLASTLVQSSGTDVMSYSSGIVDADVFRVARTMTAFETVYRTTVHPLFAILVTPIGAALRAVFAGPSPLEAARVVALLGVLAQAWLTGVLARQLAGSWWGFPFGGGLF